MLLFSVRSYAWNLTDKGECPQSSQFQTVRVLQKSMVRVQPSKISDPIASKSYTPTFMECTDSLYQNNFTVNQQTESFLLDKAPESSLINIFNHEMNNLKKFPVTNLTKGNFLSKILVKS
jgi:hypothetical protein